MKAKIGVYYLFTFKIKHKRFNTYGYVLRFTITKQVSGRLSFIFFQQLLVEGTRYNRAPAIKCFFSPLARESFTCLVENSIPIFATLKVLCSSKANLLALGTYPLERSDRLPCGY